MQRLQIRDQLPELWIGQFCPRGHPFLHASIKQQPVQIALGSLMLNPFSFQRGTLLYALSISPVTLSAVFFKNDAAGGNRVRLLLVRIVFLVVAGWDLG